MQMFVPIYCILAAITIAWAGIHMKLLFAFYVAGTTLCALAAGKELRSLFVQPSPVAKLMRAVIAVVIFIAALWLGRRSAIDLYYYVVNGTVWCIIGGALGFSTKPDIIERRKRRRKHTAPVKPTP